MLPYGSKFVKRIGAETRLARWRVAYENAETNRGAAALPYNACGKPGCGNGGTYPLYVSGEKGYKRTVKEEKAEMIRLFFRYVDENAGSGYALKWSDWLR